MWANRSLDVQLRGEPLFVSDPLTKQRQPDVPKLARFAYSDLECGLISDMVVERLGTVA